MLLQYCNTSVTSGHNTLHPRTLPLSALMLLLQYCNGCCYSTVTHPSHQVIILSTCGTPPYPTTIAMPWTKNPEWIWDWSSRPEATPPKVSFPDLLSLLRGTPYLCRRCCVVRLICVVAVAWYALSASSLLCGTPYLRRRCCVVRLICVVAVAWYALSVSSLLRGTPYLHRRCCMVRLICVNIYLRCTFVS